MLCLCLLCSLLFCSVVNVSAATESEVTADGWVKYNRLNLVTLTYKVNTGQNEDYQTTSYGDLKLPYGPLYKLVDEDPISEFWVTVSANNMDIDTGDSELAVVQPGETVSISWRVKLWMAYRYDQDAYTQVDASMYSCRIYLDDNYTKYLSPELSASNSNGGTLYYNFTNNTDKAITLSRVTIGVFEGDNLLLDAFGYGFYIAGFQYRLFTNAQQAAQAVADAIDKQTEEIKDAVEEQTEEHRNMFERLGDRISGFFSDLTNSIKGFFDDLLTGILDGIKKLFIPEDGYFTEYFAAWDLWMTDHFGALYYPFDLMLDILNRFLTLEVPERPTITFPAIQVGQYKLSEPVTVDLINAFAGDGWFQDLSSLYEMYKVVVVVVFVFALANLARKKLNSIMGGGE